MQFLLIGTLAFSLSSTSFNKYNVNLPPINNIYKTHINIPFIGSQIIEYERIKNFKSTVRLNGLLNEVGYIYMSKNNPYDYTFDIVLENIVKKYKCEFYNPYYDMDNDMIIFKIKIKLLNFKKNIVLKKI
tara:strand:- start:65 stop:454 length:390 start_codon:yes stop_codon:yes gene_type:complete